MTGSGMRRSALALVCVAGALALAHAAVQRRVLGTVRVAGPVQSAIEPEKWQPLTGGAAVEGMYLKTGSKATAVVQLSNGELVALAEESSCRLGTGSPLRVHCGNGRVAYRFQPGSKTAIETTQGAVRAPIDQASSSGGREGLVTIADNSTVLRAYRGSAELVGPGENVTLVDAGHVATLESDAPEPVVQLADASSSGGSGDDDNDDREAGWFDWFPSVFGLSHAQSAALVGGTVAAVGVGVGVGASVGGGGSGSSSSQTSGGGGGGGGGGQGSPFKTSQRNR